MNRFRLRGTWEDDPEPIPFPTHQAGRHAGARTGPAHLSTDELIASVGSELEAVSYRFEELRRLFDTNDDGPSAA
jgi:hypothetical protein